MSGVSVRRSVIVLEPDGGIQRMLSAVLSFDGLEPLVVGDGVTAVRLMRVTRPVAYIIDLSRWTSTLERDSRRGVGFLHYLQRNRPAALRRVIVTSALSDRDLPPNLPRVHRFLRKPFNLDELREALRECASDPV